MAGDEGFRNSRFYLRNYLFSVEKVCKRDGKQKATFQSATFISFILIQAFCAQPITFLTGGP
ncbi:hypothetical protein DHD08_02850 [Arenibacter sp. H213]|nr:hypothetical protein [Arenibacter sp. H213]